MLKEEIISVCCTTPVRLASLQEESTFPFVIGTFVFGEKAARDTYYTWHSAPVLVCYSYCTD